MASLADVAIGIRAQLGFTVRDIWSDRARGIPPWVYEAVTHASVLRVLQLAQASTVELGVPSDFLNQTSPAELETYWSIVFRDLYDQELPRFPVKVEDVEVAIAKRIGTAIFAMHQQSTRYINFLRFGPPPGVRQFPEFTGSERTKTLAVPWDWRRTAAQPNRTLQYQSCTTARARRVQSLRSQQCAPSDVLNPSLFN
jgi:hypothetical protein